MPKVIFIVRNRIILQLAGILDFSEAAIHSHLFSKIYPENTGSRALVFVKLRTDCSKERLYTKMPSSIMFCVKSSESFQNARIS